MRWPSALAAAVPAVAAWTTTPALPKAISPEHAQRAIDSCDLSTRVGLRDRAVLLLLARLGLRAHEIIALQLEDCDWDGGYLRVRGKCGREQLLPIPADVGEAIAAYLQQGRPAESGSAFVLAVDGTDPRIDARLRCHRHDRAPRAPARPGRRTASRVTPVSPRLGSAHAATGRLVDRDRRSPSPPKPTDHLDLRPGGYQRAAFRWPCRGREVCDEHPA